MKSKAKPKKAFTVILEADLRRKLAEIAARENRSLGSVARIAIEAYVRVAPAGEAAA